MTRRVFITGASSGLGEALARAYARHEPGVILGLAARRTERLQALAAELTGAQCHCYQVDVLQPEMIRAAAADFERIAGGVDIVIANAGISAGTVAGEPGNTEVFARIVQTNLTALAATFDAFLPAMQARGTGALVGVASVAGIRGMPGAGAYSASKAGAIAYLESLRAELHRTPLQVVTLAPGFMDADRFADKAVQAIDRGRSFTVIPWQMGWVARGLRCLPNRLFDWAFSRAPRKARLQS